MGSAEALSLHNPITVHIGITIGTAFCGCVGAPNRCEYSVMGPSVNLAARLMQYAGRSCGEAGGVVTSQEVKEEVERRSLVAPG